MKPEERRRAALEWLRMPAAPGEPCKVKLCGMSRRADIDAVLAVGPDMCGFIVDFPKSHRSIPPERVAELCARMDAAEGEGAGGVPGETPAPGAPDAVMGATSIHSATGHPIWRVGVFVDKPAVEVAGIVARCGLDLVQLHGHEDAAYVEELRGELGSGTGIVQAVKVHSARDVDAACSSEADMVLLDNGQGTGESFDWSLVESVPRPFLLAGGLDSLNVAEAIAQVRPWGVDMSSGIETGGFKDPSKMEAAVEAARGAAR